MPLHVDNDCSSFLLCANVTWQLRTMHLCIRDRSVLFLFICDVLCATSTSTDISLIAISNALMKSRHLTLRLTVSITLALALSNAVSQFSLACSLSILVVGSTVQVHS